MNQVTKKRRHAEPDELRQWSTAVQFAFLESFATVTGWVAKDVAFHGGTSLAMSWGSPRYSEDLDFLLNEHLAQDKDEFSQMMASVVDRVNESLSLTIPGLSVELRDKTRKGSSLLNYQLVASKPHVLNKAMVKSEFWVVDDDYLKHIETAMVFPAQRGDIVSRSVAEIPAVTMQAAVADKLTALATRPFLKWRDLFDLHFLANQNSETPAQQAERFLLHVQAYNPVKGLSPKKALEYWLDKHNTEQGRAALLEAAVEDLQPWLPPTLWERLWPDGVVRMIDTSIKCVEQVVNELDDDTRENRKRPTP